MQVALLRQVAASLTGAFLMACTGIAIPAPSATPPEAARPARECGPPGFPYQEGWFGGDAAYSVMLGPGRVLWLFGDSFVGTPDTPSRAQAEFIHNSVAVAECGADGHWQLDYAWGRDDAGGPAAFFPAPRSPAYRWLFDGFVHRDALYVGLLGVVPSEPRGPFLLPFRFTGAALARVENPQAPPAAWRWEVLALSDDGSALPLSAIVPDGDHLYLFTFLDRGDGHFPRALSRLPLEALDGDPASLPAARELLAENGTWLPAALGDDPRIVMADDATEMSVAYHPELERWVALYSPLGRHPETGEPSDRVAFRTAEALEGPWSEPVTVFRIPELEPDRPGRDPNTFCYAAKEHPALAHDGRLLFTYVCNLFTKKGEDPYTVLQRLQQQQDLYRPRAVSLPLPLN